MEARYLTDLEWRICHAVNIYVFRNGRDGEQPILVHIPPAKKKNMKTVMNVIQDRVKYPVGYAKYLFKMDGTRVRDPCELEMYNNYVVASNFEKHFKCAAYGRKRSPLLVLNRDSKHVRVLKLQNQNYYEWLLKKKAVGEERPHYIYPPYYTNENKLPQDLPMGKMGNYNPGQVHAPGCCYPTEEGGRTYRLNSQQYEVNQVTVDVNPSFRNMPIPMIDFKDKRKSKYGSNDMQSKYGSKHGKMREPTPSDMLNANVLSDGGSPEVVSVTTTSESDDQRRMLAAKNHKGSNILKNPKQVRQPVSLQKPRVQRVHIVTSEEYPQQSQQKHRHGRSNADMTGTTTATTQSSQEIMKKRRQQQQQQQQQHHTPRVPHPHVSHKKSSSSKHKMKREIEQHQQSILKQITEIGIPPPPSQFQDSPADLNNNKNAVTTMRILAPVVSENQNILNYVGRAMNDQIADSPQKSFYYSPEKLAEINAAGNIQPMELSFATNSQPPQTFQQVNQQASTHPAGTQWAIVQQSPQQQMVQQVYAIESQPGGPGTPTTTTLIPASSIDASGMIGPYTMASIPAQQQNNSSPGQLMQSLTMPQGGGVLHPVSSQQMLQSGNPTGQQQCIVIPNNCTPQGTQFIAVPNTPSQSHLQQVYQLGIVQQPNPQTCIQVDAKAMRQYVDNQKLIECRFQQHLQQQQCPTSPGDDRSKNKGRRKQQRQRKCSDVTDITETEVDIPFTPLKTYRLENPPNVTQSHSSVGQAERSQNPSRYRNERLPKVKSRNVAIQMGYPASARSSRAVNEILDCIRRNDTLAGGGGGMTRYSDNSFTLNNNTNRSRSDSMANAINLGPSLSSLLRTPKAERERFFLQNNSSTGSGRGLRRSGNFCSSYSDQYVGRHTGRSSLFPPITPSNYPSTSCNNNPYSAISARRRLSSDPVLDDLITIPPPTEFRGYPLHSTRHQHDHQLDNSNALNSDNVKKLFNNNPSDHSMYPYTNNERSQYMYSRYP